MAYLSIKRKGQADYMEYVKEQGFSHFPGWRMDIGWKGVSTLSTGLNGRLYELSLPVNDFFSAIVEVDAYSPEAGLLSVDRKGIDLSQTFKSALQDLHKDVENFYNELLSDNLQSKFALLNHSFTMGSLPPIEDMKWIKGVRDSEHLERRVAVWDRISLPVFLYSRSITGWGDEKNILQDFDEEKMSWCGSNVSTFHSLSRLGRSAYTWRTSRVLPDRIVEFTHRSKLFLAALWTKQSIENGNSTNSLSIGQKCSFSPEWTSLVIVRLSDSGANSLSFLNSDNVLTQLFDETRYSELLSKLTEVFDPLPIKETILGDRLYSATWLLGYLAKSRGESEERKCKLVWDALPQRDPLFLSSLWKVIGLDDATSFHIWHGETQNGYLLEVSPRCWTKYNDTKVIRQRLPKPLDEWRLQQMS